jgi:hypothetical protein
LSYQLVLSKPEEGGKKAVGSVFFDNLPSDSKVYLLYYPGPMPNKELENRLRQFGKKTGKNLFVNIGTLEDPKLRDIAKEFDINRYPVIIVTANAELASHPVEYETAYAKLDSERVLNSPDLAIDCLQKLFALFIQGKIAEALRQPGKYDQKAFLSRLKDSISNALKGIEFSVSLFGGKLEVKRKGG